MEDLLIKYKKDLVTFTDLLNSCSPNSLLKIKDLRYKVSCHKNMIADLESITSKRDKSNIIKILNENTKWVLDHDTKLVHSCRFEEISERIINLPIEGYIKKCNCKEPEEDLCNVNACRKCNNPTDW